MSKQITSKHSFTDDEGDEYIAYELDGLVYLEFDTASIALQSKDVDTIIELLRKAAA